MSPALTTVHDFANNPAVSSAAAAAAGGGEIILATLRGKRRAYGPKEDRLQVCAGICYDL